MAGQAMAKIAALIVALGLAAAPAVRAYTPPQLNKPAAFCQYEVFLNNGKDVQINELNFYNLPRRLFGYRRCQIADHYTEFVVDWFYGHHHHFPRGVLGVPASLAVAGSRRLFLRR